MKRLLTITSLVICLAAFVVAEGQSVSSASLCAFAPLREVPAEMVRLLALKSAPAKAQRRKDENAVNLSCAPVGFWHWAPESTVHVYIKANDFSADEIAFLLTPLKNWNAVAAETGSQVKFEYKGLTNAPRHCANCLTIARGTVFDKKHRHLTELRSFNDPQQRTMLWATIVIDPQLTNHGALTNAVAHELGHSFGLLDCYSCKDKSTVMNQFKTVNTPNHMNGPTACDVAQVRSAYRAHANHAAQKKIVVDEGEEPVDDDTPIVVPKP